MFAKREGSCRGMGGSMRITDFSKGMLGAFAIVGSGIPIATGAALSARVRGSGQVAVSFFGDGAVNEGIFHEALNMAALWKLPAIYIIENNQYALSMTVAESSAVPNLGFESLCAYGMLDLRVDGNDVLAVYEATREAVERARAGEGPTLIETLTYRIRGHAGFEAAGYRPETVVESWKSADPIERLAAGMIAGGLATEAQLSSIRQDAEAAIEEAIEYAGSCSDVEAEDYLAYITTEN